MMLRQLAFVLITGLIGLVTMAPASAKPEPVMEKAEAAAYYLAAACEKIAVIDRFYEELWQGRPRVTRAEVEQRLPEFRRESRRLGYATYKFRGALNNPPAAWPADVDGAVADSVSHEYWMKQAFFGPDSTYDFLDGMGYASSGRRWLRMHDVLLIQYSNNDQHSAKIRRRLDLPPPGQGCGEPPFWVISP